MKFRRLKLQVSIREPKTNGRTLAVMKGNLNARTKVFMGYFLFARN
jgi:hypothetical protein